MGLSAQTSAERLRIVISSRLQATATSLAPKGKRLVAFLDDFNMPSLDRSAAMPRNSETVLREGFVVRAKEREILADQCGRC